MKPAKPEDKDFTLFSGLNFLEDIPVVKKLFFAIAAALSLMTLFTDETALKSEIFEGLYTSVCENQTLPGGGARRA